MNRRLATFWFTGALLLIAAVPARAQTPAQAQTAEQAATVVGSRTIWDGVYTEAQAKRGARAVEQNCGACHSPSDWATSRFIADWSGRPIGDLHTLIRNTMPFDSPGRLTPEQYADIVAYMLQLNDAPAGSEELPSDQTALSKIAVTRGGTAGK